MFSFESSHNIFGNYSSLGQAAQGYYGSLLWDFMSHINNNFGLVSEPLPSTPNEAEQIVEFCQIGRCRSFYDSLLANSPHIAFHIAFHVCVSCFSLG